jgi:signal transduction histidine kinase
LNVRHRRPDLVAAYTVALQHYLTKPEEPGLACAHELGRRALKEGLGVLDMATLHSCALSSALQLPMTDTDRAKVLEALERFFLETLSPFEMAHRGFWEANEVLHRLNDVLEGQARRIAAQLHDESAQLLASVHFALAEAARGVPADTATAIHAARGLLDQIEQRLRTLAHELRPPILEDLGLGPALNFLAETVSKRWGHPITVQVSLLGDLPNTIEATLYRIVQEALTNVMRHSKATHAGIVITQGMHFVMCSVRDDGVGIEAPAVSANGRRGLGVVEIQERVSTLGGVFRLGRARPHGTELSVEIPLES